MTMSPAVERMRAHLAALPGGIGCRHLARERDGLDAGTLVDLGLVKPIVRSVPRCADHVCPWQPRCAHWSAFEPDSPGPVAGVKYRPTPRGEAAAGNAGVIAAALAALPAAADILARLREGPASVFTLHTLFLTRARVSVRAGAEPDEAGLNRVTLGAVLELLVEGRQVVRGEDGVTFEVGEDGS